MEVGTRRERQLFASDDEGSDGSDADETRDDEAMSTDPPARGSRRRGRERGRGVGADDEANGTMDYDDDESEDEDDEDENLAREIQNGIDLDEDEEDEGYGDNDRSRRAKEKGPETDENEYMVEDDDEEIYRHHRPSRAEAGTSSGHARRSEYKTPRQQSCIYDNDDEGGQVEEDDDGDKNVEIDVDDDDNRREGEEDDDDDPFLPNGRQVHNRSYQSGYDPRFPIDQDGYTMIPDDVADEASLENPYEVVDIPTPPPKPPRKRGSANRRSLPSAPIPAKTRATVSYRRARSTMSEDAIPPPPTRPPPSLPNRPASTIETRSRRPLPPLPPPSRAPTTVPASTSARTRSLPLLKRTSSMPTTGKKRPDPRAYFQEALRISKRPARLPSDPETDEPEPPTDGGIANENNNARHNQVNRDPPKLPPKTRPPTSQASQPSQPAQPTQPTGATSSPRNRRELGFSATVTGNSDVQFIRACLHDAYVHQTSMLNACIPMPAYVLQALAEPIVSRRAIRMTELVRPMIKTVLMINYYHIGTGKLARMRNLARRAMNPAAIENLKRKLGPLLPPQDSAAPPLPLRLLGRLNITDAQHAACAGTLDRLLKPARDSERRVQHVQCARAFRSKNLLFKAFRFTREEARELYLRNLAILNDDTDEESEVTLLTETQPYPTRDAIVNEAIFCLALGNMINSFDRTLTDLRGMIHLLLEDLVETMYFAYVQLPVLKDDFRVFFGEVANEVNSPRTDSQGLAALSRRMLAFARRCYNLGAFVVPAFTRYLVRCASLWDAGYAGYSMEKAATSLASPDLLRSASNTETTARRLLGRTTHFTKIEPMTRSGPQLQVTHIPGNSTAELAVRAARAMANSTPRTPLPDEASSAAMITGAFPRRPASQSR